MGALCLAFAAGIELVARGLRRRRYWGWVAGVGILTLTPELATLEDLFFRLTEDGHGEDEVPQAPALAAAPAS